MDSCQIGAGGSYPQSGKIRRFTDWFIGDHLTETLDPHERENLNSLSTLEFGFPCHSYRRNCIEFLDFFETVDKVWSIDNCNCRDIHAESGCIGIPSYIRSLSDLFENILLYSQLSTWIDIDL